MQLTLSQLAAGSCKWDPDRGRSGRFPVAGVIPSLLRNPLSKFLENGYQALELLIKRRIPILTVHAQQFLPSIARVISCPCCIESHEHVCNICAGEHIDEAAVQL